MIMTMITSLEGLSYGAHEKGLCHIAYNPDGKVC